MKNSKYMIFAAMGFELVAMVITLIYLGQWFDREYGWGGLGVAGGAMIALISWITHLVILAKRVESQGDGE